MFITFSAISKGLHVGYCGSYNGKNDWLLLIGIGYKDTNASYIHPLTNNKTKSRSRPDLGEEHKPKFEKYIAKHY